MVGDSELLREIRDLLRVIAEPALAERDKRLRTLLLEIVGKSKRKADAIALMNGARSQTAIQKECGIDFGDLSRLVKTLREAELIGPDDKHPIVAIPLPSSLFENVGKSKK
jgi:hypothetical protein